MNGNIYKKTICFSWLSLSVVCICGLGWVSRVYQGGRVGAVIRIAGRVDINVDP